MMRDEHGRNLISSQSEHQSGSAVRDTQKTMPDRPGGVFVLSRIGRAMTPITSSMRRVIDALKAGPMLADELCVAANIARNTFDSCVRRPLLAAELMHVCGWVKNKAGIQKARFAYGPGVSVERTKGGAPGIALDGAGAQRAIAVLERSTEPMRCDQIAACANLSINYFKGEVRPALLNLGKMHLAGWTLHGTVYSPLYLSGPATEKAPPRPGRMSVRLVKDRYKARQESLRYRPPDPALAALLGLAV